MATEQTSDQDSAALEDQPYDGRKLSYATTFPNPLQRKTIQTIEFLTGKWRLLSCIRAFERRGIPKGHAFFAQALDVMGIDVKRLQNNWPIFRNLVPSLSRPIIPMVWWMAWCWRN